MSAITQPRTFRVVPGTVQRRWRLAALIGAGVALLLAVYAIFVLGPGADANQMVSVLRAAKAIKAGTTITADDLSVTTVRTGDPGVLATLMRSSDESQLVGQVASMDVPAGNLVPAAVLAPQSTAGFWEVHVPVRSQPDDLAAGDHVAILVNGNSNAGQPVEFVFIQDVRIISIGQGGDNLWLPAKLAPQVQWFSDHGGLVLMKMQAGQVQNQVPAGGGS